MLDKKAGRGKVEREPGSMENEKHYMQVTPVGVPKLDHLSKTAIFAFFQCNFSQNHNIAMKYR